MGDYDRLKQLMKRAECGDTITIGFLGGSITQGSLASSDKKPMRIRFLNGGSGSSRRHSFNM